MLDTRYWILVSKYFLLIVTRATTIANNLPFATLNRNHFGRIDILHIIEYMVVPNSRIPGYLHPVPATSSIFSL